MAHQKNPYEVLGLPEDVDEKTLKRIRRKLASRLHPDKTGGDASKLRLLQVANEALDVLQDMDTRATLDRKLADHRDVQRRVAEFFASKARRVAGKLSAQPAPPRPSSMIGVTTPQPIRSWGGLAFHWSEGRSAFERAVMTGLGIGLDVFVASTTQKRRKKGRRERA